MMKNVILAATVLCAAACSKPAATTDADGGATSVSTSSTSTTTVGSIVDKALSFVSASPFEGEITMNVSEAGKPAHTIVYDVKGTKMRFDAPNDTARDGGGYMIFDSATKKMITVTDSKKMAFTMDLGKDAPDPTAAAAAAKTPAIDKTGKMDTVAGYSCEIWNVSEDKTEVCVAKGIAFPMMGRRAAGWQSGLENAFPLRAVTKDATGAEKSRMEVTKVEKKTIDDARFEVPAGYSTMSMEDMMKGLGAGMRPHR